MAGLLLIPCLWSVSTKLRLLYRCLKAGRKGFLLLDLQMALAVVVALSLLLATSIGQLGKSWRNVQLDNELRACGRYMLTNMERELSYEAASIKIWKSWDGNINLTAQTINGSRSVTFVCQQGLLYKKTKTAKGTGTNPLFLKGTIMKNWQPRKLENKRLLLSFTLEQEGRSMDFTRLLYCSNVQEEADGYNG